MNLSGSSLPYNTPSTEEPDDAAAMHVIERAEHVRMQQNIRRALMLLAMSKVLMAEQRAKLSTLVDSPPLTLPR